MRDAYVVSIWLAKRKYPGKELSVVKHSELRTRTMYVGNFKTSGFIDIYSEPSIYLPISTTAPVHFIPEKPSTCQDSHHNIYHKLEHTHTHTHTHKFRVVSLFIFVHSPILSRL